MLQTSTRLLKLLSLLQSRRFWTGPDLAEALEITERSVRRDVDRLRELGYPVHAASGVGGGYSLGAGKDLPPLPLDDDEAVAVAFGLRAIATGWVTGLEQASIRALSKIEQVLPRRLRARLGDLHAVSLHLPDRGPRVDGAVLSALTNACRDERLLRFYYRDRAGARRLRHVEPYRLVHAHGRWYLLAWDRDREDWRTFRADRVEAEIEVSHVFRLRPLPADDVVAYVAAASPPERWRYRARLTVQAPAAMVSRQIPEGYGQVRELGEERCELITGGDDLAWLAAYLGLLGHEFVVHEPAELVEYMAGLAGRLGRAVAGQAR